ncbi:MAG: hypothetical protein AAGJ86_10275 [Pseudomonadota bacterium]
MPLLSLLPFFGFAALLQRSMRWSAATALILTVSIWSLTLLLGAYLNLLWWTAAILWLVGLVAAIALILSLLRQHDRVTPPAAYIFIAIAALAFWWVHRTSGFFYFDEFAHWGIFLKDLWAADALWGADSNSLHPRYPPIAPLWQYGFVIFAPRTEASAYFAHFVLLVTPLCLLFERFDWRQHAVWLPTLLVGFAVGLANFGHAVASIYVDHLLATWLFGAVMLALLWRDAPPMRLVWLALPLAVLTLLKDTGIAFAAAGAGLAAAIVFIERARKTPRRSFAHAVSAVLIAALVLAPAFGGRVSWSMNRDAAGVANDAQSMGNIVDGVVRGKRILSEADSALVETRFLDAFLNQQISKDAVSAQYNAYSYDMADAYTDRWRLSTAGFYGLFAVFFIIVLALGRRHLRPAWAIAAAGLLVTGLCYSLMLYLSYQFAFGERGLILSSYVRYTHSIVLAMWLLMLAAALPTIGALQPDTSRPAKPAYRGAIVMLAGLAIFCVFETPYLKPLYETNRRIPQRDQNAALMTAISETLRDRKLWVYFPNDMPNGMLGHIMQYQLTPTPTTIERARTFATLADADIERVLREHDVIWLPVSNPQLDAAIARIFSVSLDGRFLERDPDNPDRYRLMEF